MDDDCSGKSKVLNDRVRCILQSTGFLTENSKPFKDEKKMLEEVTKSGLPSSFPKAYVKGVLDSNCHKKIGTEKDEEGMACILDVIPKVCSGKY
ncbi:unnamed protein product [Allacma fusca]|uniref:Uncharacterized protein n=1 Tax=Allacma fusca TaxID=39272 RepID=A0A8J2KCX3_9HEXA|nr:unnamed protein product [Allacma fusca]